MRFEYPTGILEEGLCLYEGIYFEKDKNGELQLGDNVDIYLGNKKVSNSD